MSKIETKINHTSEENTNTSINQDPNLPPEIPTNLPSLNDNPTVVTILALTYFCRVLLQGISNMKK